MRHYTISAISAILTLTLGGCTIGGFAGSDQLKLEDINKSFFGVYAVGSSTCVIGQPPGPMEDLDREAGSVGNLVGGALIEKGFEALQQFLAGVAAGETWISGGTMYLASAETLPECVYLVRGRFTDLASSTARTRDAPDWLRPLELSPREFRDLEDALKIRFSDTPELLLQARLHAPESGAAALVVDYFAWTRPQDQKFLRSSDERTVTVAVAFNDSSKTFENKNGSLTEASIPLGRLTAPTVLRFVCPDDGSASRQQRGDEQNAPNFDGTPPRNDVGQKSDCRVDLNKSKFGQFALMSPGLPKLPDSSKNTLNLSLFVSEALPASGPLEFAAEVLKTANKEGNLTKALKSDLLPEQRRQARFADQAAQAARRVTAATNRDDALSAALTCVSSIGEINAPLAQDQYSVVTNLRSGLFDYLLTAQVAGITTSQELPDQAMKLRLFPENNQMSIRNICINIATLLEKDLIETSF